MNPALRSGVRRTFPEALATLGKRLSPEGLGGPGGGVPKKGGKGREKIRWGLPKGGGKGFERVPVAANGHGAREHGPL